MVRTFSSRLDEGKVTLQLLEALGSSLDIRAVLKEAYPLLTRLAPADYGALGVSPSARPEAFEWTVAELPAAFFAAYPEMVAHDFVRSSVAKKPNVVIRDQEMVSRRELENNMMYRRAREVGAPIEQVMAVMLHVDDRWQSGLSLYRERRRPFSVAERARLQRVTPALANAVRNCHLFGLATEWKLALEQLIENSRVAVLLVSHDASEVARSPGATRLMDGWFDRHERRGSRLPEVLASVLQAAVRAGAPASWSKVGAGSTLEVSFLPLTGNFGDARWMLRLEEQPDALCLPEHWRALLTQREQEVTGGVLQGWDNRLIGEQLGCTVATVKRHLQSIFEKLGVDSRTLLVVRAARSARD
jgi:DNA-binding CsgD family transcriptional regulator